MGRPQRSPNTRFDDIPGELPQGCAVPQDSNLKDLAETAVSKLNNLQPDDLTDHAIWRDLLSMTGTLRTFESKDRVHATLQKLSLDKRRSNIRSSDAEPRIAQSGDISWIDVDILFSTHGDLVGQCAGIVSITCSPDGAWRIWMLRTWLENFEGHGHPEVLEPTQLTNGVANVIGNTKPEDHVNGSGTEVEALDVLIVGGGQAGLSIAGRSKALGVNALILERHASIGDVWANRYDSLRWHTSKESGNLPFGHTFPAEDDYMLPAKRIAAGHKAWSEKYGLNIRTRTSVESARWSDKTQIWTVETSGPNGNTTLKSRDLVLAIGPGHLTPISPDWATPEKTAASGYQGTILHSSSYKSSSPWAGKRGIVIGTANTAHDVAEDMANAGMETTMVQRGSTFIFPVEWLSAAQDKHYTADKSISHGDRETYTYPNKIMREMINRGVWTGIKHNPERFDALEKAGFKVERYGDIYNNLYVRFGGHYVDIGCSARIAKGEIKVTGQAVKGLTKTGLLFEDGSQLDADLIVLCTGFDHDFRKDAERIVGTEIADQMDDFFGLDPEGELRGHAKFAGHPNLYYFGGDTRMARFFSHFIALQLQADALGKPMARYLS